jgi:hypothetical protein
MSLSLLVLTADAQLAEAVPSLTCRPSTLFDSSQQIPLAAVSATMTAPAAISAIFVLRGVRAGFSRPNIGVLRVVVECELAHRERVFPGGTQQADEEQ